MRRNYPLIKLILILLLLKASYLLFAVALSSTATGIPAYSFDIQSYIELAMQKDAYWYKSIAEHGYPSGILQGDDTRLTDFTQEQSAWAFFPAYPFLNQCISTWLSVPYEMAALITSLIFSILAICGCFLFCKSYWNDAYKAFWGTLIIFLFPFHFYFSMFLTEVPFFACLIWSFYLIRKNKLILPALLLVFLVLLRPNGILCLLPISLFYLEEKQLRSLKHLKWKHILNIILLCLPAVLLFGGYLIYQKEMTGHYLAFSAAQKGWGKEFMFPLLALFRRGDLNYQVTSCYTVLAFILLIKMRKRLSLSFFLLVGINLILPLCAGSTYSMIRYLSVSFPLFLLISELVFGWNHKVVLVCIMLGLMQLGSLYFWISGHPLGF